MIFYLIVEFFEVNDLELVAHFFGFLLKALIFDEGGKSGNESNLHKLYFTLFGFPSGGKVLLREE